MPSDAERAALRDILRHIDLAERFTRNHTFETFEIDELHLYAVTRCLEVISEASRRLSDELKARHLRDLSCVPSVSRFASNVDHWRVFGSGCRLSSVTLK
jgi:hypothetical protein